MRLSDARHFRDDASHGAMSFVTTRFISAASAPSGISRSTFCTPGALIRTCCNAPARFPEEIANKPRQQFRGSTRVGDSVPRPGSFGRRVAVCRHSCRSRRKDEEGVFGAIHEFAAASRNCALRTKFYQGYDGRSTLAYVAHGGSLFTLGEASEESVEFSMKDVCGKIIHAVTFEKYLEAQSERSPTTLSGKTQDGTGRKLSLFVSRSAEAVWNWARDTETRRPEPIAVLPAPDVALTAIRPWTEIELNHRVGARLRAAVEGAAFLPQRLPARPQRPAHHFGPCSIGND